MKTPEVPGLTMCYVTAHIARIGGYISFMLYAAIAVFVVMRKDPKLLTATLFIAPLSIVLTKMPAIVTVVRAQLGTVAGAAVLVSYATNIALVAFASGS